MSLWSMLMVYVPHSDIWYTFNRAMLRVVPNLRAYSDTLTNAMVEFYTMSQVREMQENF